ncbi:MAG: hypothetical protein FWG83_05315 [Oscillospiraceae bacterium]|nr:hypothetical protein [Oscillospiraceae bacterium]
MTLQKDLELDKNKNLIESPQLHSHRTTTYNLPAYNAEEESDAFKEEIKQENQDTLEEKTEQLEKSEIQQQLEDSFEEIKIETLAQVRQQPELPRLDSKKKRKNYKEKQEYLTEKGVQGLYNDAELKRIQRDLSPRGGKDYEDALRELKHQIWHMDNYLGGEFKEQIKENGEKVLINDVPPHGSFAQFENLPVPLRNELATRYMNEVFQPQYGNHSLEQMKSLCVLKGTEFMLNPLLRLGISLGMRSGHGTKSPEFFKQLDNELCRQVMVETLVKRPAEDEINSSSREDRPILEDRIKRNCGSQIFIAKNLLLAHMGNMQKVNADGTSQPWDVPVATAFAHCSRVHYIFPPMTANTQKQKDAHVNMWNVFHQTSEIEGLEEDKWFGAGNNGGMFKRGGSTHDLQRRRVNGSKPAKEIKKTLSNLSGQRGMNVAIGGLGNRGVQGRKILNNGTCGHIYSMKKDAEVGICGGYLVGFESDEHKKTNQLGHTHDMLATGEKSSSFGGQRSDEIGKKYGGREVDLSQIPPEELSENMLVLEHAIRYAMKHNHHEDLRKIMDMLTGNLMNEERWEEFRKFLKEARKREPIKRYVKHDNTPKLPLEEVSSEYFQTKSGKQEYERQVDELKKKTQAFQEADYDYDVFDFDEEVKKETQKAQEELYTAGENLQKAKKTKSKQKAQEDVKKAQEEVEKAKENVKSQVIEAKVLKKEAKLESARIQAEEKLRIEKKNMEKMNEIYRKNGSTLPDDYEAKEYNERFATAYKEGKK